MTTESRAEPEPGDEARQPEPREITSVQDLMDVLGPITSDGTERWYRGHRDKNWQLTASAYRSKNLREAEQAMLARFRQEAASMGVQYGFDEWGWITFGQHHRLPTRLLDWSQSPLVALFFACENGDQTAETAGEFFILNPSALNIAAGDADGHLRLLSDNDTDLTKYLPGADAGYRQNPRAVAAPLLFDRIRFQAGTFTVEQTPRSTNDEPLRTSSAVQQFLIPEAAKVEIRAQLETLGFNHATIYKDLDQIALRIKKAQGGR